MPQEFLNLLLLQVSLATLFLTLIHSQQPNKPGDRCEAPGDCQQSSGLTCFLPTRRCGCLHDPHAQFNYNSMRCEVLADEKCEFQGSLVDCTPNSVCQLSSPGNYICECQPGYTKTTSGKCVKKIQEPCTLDSECDQENFQICFNGFCNCDLNQHSFYEPHLQKCVISVYATCDPAEYKQPCQVFAECVKHSPQNATWTCRCKDDLLPNVDDECVHSYDEPCFLIPKDSCNYAEFLKCGSFVKCECSSPRIQYYDFDDHTCKIRAGQNCTVDVPKSPGCTEFSRCMLPGGSDLQQTRCVCQPGLMESAMRMCVLPHGSVCEFGGKPSCDGESFHECHPSSHTCECKDAENTWYDEKTKNCFLLEGASCTPKTRDTPLVQPCAPNSECISVGKGRGKCMCSVNFEKNKDRRCFLPMGSECNCGKDLCDRSAFLECNSTTRICDCGQQDNILLQESTQTCVIKASHECNMNREQEACVLHSKCKPKDGISVCLCDDGLVPGITGNCVKEHGDMCKENGFGADLCDIQAFQHCSPKTGICECQDTANMTYSEKNRICKLKLNSVCLPGSAPCDTGLVCQNDRCMCNTELGFVQDSEGKCTLVHGQVCEATTTEDSSEHGYSNHDMFQDSSRNGVLMESEVGRKCNSDLFLTCLEGRCECLESHPLVMMRLETGLEKRCVGKFNAVCRTNHDCQMNNSMVCNDQYVCQCYLPLEQYYDLEHAKCVGKIGSSCHVTRAGFHTLDKDGKRNVESSHFEALNRVDMGFKEEQIFLQCGKGMVCREGNHPIYGICECEPDKFPHESGVCISYSLDLKHPSLKA